MGDPMSDFAEKMDVFFNGRSSVSKQVEIRVRREAVTRVLKSEAVALAKAANAELVKASIAQSCHGSHRGSRLTE
jgi:hypothetical protein